MTIDTRRIFPVRAVEMNIGWVSNPRWKVLGEPTHELPKLDRDFVVPSCQRPSRKLSHEFPYNMTVSWRPGEDNYDDRRARFMNIHDAPWKLARGSDDWGSGKKKGNCQRERGCSTTISSVVVPNAKDATAAFLPSSKIGSIRTMHRVIRIIRIKSNTKLLRFEIFQCPDYASPEAEVFDEYLKYTYSPKMPRVVWPNGIDDDKREKGKKRVKMSLLVFFPPFSLLAALFPCHSLSLSFSRLFSV